MDHHNDTTSSKGNEVLVDFVVLLWSKRYKIIGIAIIFMLMALIYAMSLPRMYRATANVQIGGQQNNVVAIEQLYVLDERSSSHMNTQVELLRSRAIARKVIAQMSLETHPEYTYRQPNLVEYWKSFVLGRDNIRPQLHVDVTRQELEEIFRRNLTISPIRDSEILQISFDAHDPKLAAGVANGVVAAYIDYHRDSRSQVTEQTTQWLLEQLEEQRVNLRNAEAKLSEFSKNEDLIDMSGILGLVSKELNQITSQIIDARRNVEDIKVKSELAITLNKKSIRSLLEMEEVRSHPSIKNIRQRQFELELKESELAKRYGPKHPKRLALAAEKQAVESNLNRQLQQVFSALDNRYRDAELKVKGLENTFKEVKAAYQRLSNVQSTFTQMQRDVEAHQKLYDTFLTRLQETKATDDLEHNYARLIDPAVIPTSPFKPSKSVILLVGTFFGGMVGVFLVLAKSLIRGVLTKAEEVESSLGLDVLIELPLIKTKGTDPVRALSNDPYFAEAIRGLRTRLQLSGGFNQLVAITSTVSGEGKSSVAFQLAKACGEMEKVLLIDADMRQPSVNEMLYLPHNIPGLSNVLARTHRVGECVQRNPEWNIDVICAGEKTHDPLNFLASKKFKVLIQGLREHYDRIIIETGPIQAVSDAQVVSAVADKLLYIVRADQTSKSDVKGGLDRLRKVHAPILGIVLNKVSGRRTGGLSAAYYETQTSAKLVQLSQARRTRNSG
ncbi:GumC family protein [Echinimonas agarilytica]|uniref:Polysaccharide biosynthesis tyrosine autokinase n=1 Tax=Echinimonas agarilytica TaxID=1215918 RepID=A0AA41W483_9GAMM|nr:polysaccharide biosynthesis tyrosine autokinase [Echinimonas agarilytica]MCM2678537.1 polysaccharide biosynthesis tyrosine autokinase [Echinimonas agarilytica]